MRSAIPVALVASLVAACAPSPGVYPPFLPREWTVHTLVAPARHTTMAAASILAIDARHDAGRPPWRLALDRDGRYRLADRAGAVRERGRWHSAMTTAAAAAAPHGPPPWELCFSGPRGGALAGPTGRRCGGVWANSAGPDTMLLVWVERPGGSPPPSHATTPAAAATAAPLELFLRAPSTVDGRAPAGR